MAGLEIKCLSAILSTMFQHCCQRSFRKVDSDLNYVYPQHNVQNSEILSSGVVRFRVLMRDSKKSDPFMLRFCLAIDQ